MTKLDEMVRVSLSDGRSWLNNERYFSEEDYADAEEYPGVTFEHNPDATGLELAGLIDSELESANFHSLVGFATDLHGIIQEASNKEVANKVLELLWEKGTIQNLY